MDEKKRLLKNTVIISVGSITTKMLSFFLIPFYTIYLNNTEYGLYDYICTLGTCIVPIMSMLMDESMFRFLIDCKSGEEKKAVITNSLLIQILGMLLIVIFGCVSYYIFNIKYSFFITLYYFACSMAYIINPILRGQGLFILYTLYNAAISLLLVTLTIVVVVFFDMKVDGLLLANASAHIIISILIGTYIKIWRFFDFHFYKLAKIREMVLYSLPLIPNRIALVIMSIADRIIIISFLDFAVAGIYAVANKLATVIGVIYGFFGIAWPETAARVVKTEDSKDLYNNLFFTTYYFLASILIWILTIIPYVFYFFIDVKFFEAMNYIPLLFLSAYFYCLAIFLGGILTAHKDTVAVGYTTISAVTTNVILGILLIDKLGVYGVSFANCVANFVMFQHRKICVNKYSVIKCFDSGFISLNIIVSSFVVFSYYWKNQYLNFFSFFFASLYLVFILKKLGFIVIIQSKIYDFYSSKICK